MLRSVLIALSRSEGMRRFVIGVRPARSMARRFVAGETLDEGIAVVRSLNQQEAMATLDHLGENVETRDDARRTVGDYQDILQRISDEGLQATVSVKLTHIGLDFGQEFCYEQAKAIVETAESLGNTVEIDIEGSEYTQATLDIFHRLLDGHQNLRLALQAYLFRTEGDLLQLMTRGSSVRLCKGAYDEDPNIAWKKQADVDANYASLTDLMLGYEAQEKGFYAALGTHDHVMILHAERFAATHDTNKNKFEFQMLYGIRRDWQKRLVDDGYRVRIYVPYGTQWYPYFMRRLAERPANLLFMLRAFLGN